MKKAKIPPVSVDATAYEKFKSLIEADGKSISTVIREFVNTYVVFRLKTGEDLNDLMQKQVQLDKDLVDVIGKYVLNKDTGDKAAKAASTKEN